jgi:hypothetical protein
MRWCVGDQVLAGPCPRAGLLPLGSSNSRLTPTDSPTVGRPGRVNAAAGEQGRAKETQEYLPVVLMQSAK